MTWLEVHHFSLLAQVVEDGVLHNTTKDMTGFTRRPPSSEPNTMKRNKQPLNGQRRRVTPLSVLLIIIV